MHEFPTADARLPASLIASTEQLLHDLAAISSQSGDRKGLCLAADHLRTALRARGLRVGVRDEVDAQGEPMPVLYARTDDDSARADDAEVDVDALADADGMDGRLLAIGHLDTVLPAVAPETRGRHLWGTGTVDMKAGLVALVGALDLLALRGLAPPPLCLVVVPDEEVTGLLSQQVVERLGPAARGLWVLEPGQPADAVVPPGDADTDASMPTARETIVVGRRGMVHWRLRARGRGAHAGNAYWQGHSALLAAADWCLRARALAQPGAGPTINCGRMVSGDADFVDNLGDLADLLGTDQQTNIVPDTAIVDGEARFLRADDAGALIAALREAADAVRAAHAVDLTLDFSPIIPPVDPNGPGGDWAQRAVRAARAAGWSLVPETDRGGISFSNFLPDPAAVPVLDGLGPTGDGMHTRDEWVDLDSLPAASRCSPIC
ncbi:MAG: M20/M25/M40 family metallo-hydrolase [Acidobacteriota bacterium]